MEKFRKIGRITQQQFFSYHTVGSENQIYLSFDMPPCEHAEQREWTWSTIWTSNEDYRTQKLSTLQKYIKSDSNIEQMLEVGRKIRKY